MNTVEDIVRSLVSGEPNPAKKALMLPIMVLIAMELVVVDSKARFYDRLYSWCKLCRLWTISRNNDFKGAPAKKITMRDDGLDITIDQSKTTGVGKKIESYVVTVSSMAYIAHPCWLATGFEELWTPTVNDRDYFLPLPSNDREGVIPRMANYADATAMTAALFSELPRPRWTAEVDEDGKLEYWVQSEIETLLVGGAETAWTEHSEKHVLPSWCMALEIDAPTIDRLGHWSQKVGESYANTLRNLRVAKQEEIAFKIRHGRAGKDIVGDEAAIDGVIQHLDRIGADQHVLIEQRKKLQYFTGAGVTPTRSSPRSPADTSGAVGSGSPKWGSRKRVGETRK